MFLRIIFIHKVDSVYSLLLIEDDEQLAEVTSAYLELEGFLVVKAHNVKVSWNHITNRSFDLIILDLGLPDEDGLVLLRKLKASGTTTPIIVSSGRASNEDRIAGLELGANDYLVKPYTIKELLLRIKLLVGMHKPSKRETKQLKLGNYLLDFANKMVIDEATNEVNLTLHEQSILFLLAENSPRIYSREEIIDAVSISEGPNSVRAVDTTICRLRKKLECNAKKPAHIKTVNGLGYRLLLTASV